MQVVHSDVWGSAPITSRSGFCWYVSFIDEFSRSTWIYFLRDKDDVKDAFLLFKSQAELQSRKKVKMLQYDGRDEFDYLKSILARFEILKQVSCPNTS